MANAAGRGGSREAPFRILVLGDFTGRAGRGSAVTGRELGKRKPVRVDRDGLNELPGRLGAECRVAATESPLRLASLDDFRPEALAERIPRLRRLRDLRVRLLDARSAAAAVEEARQVLGPEAAAGAGRPTTAPRPAQGPPAPAPGEGLLDALLEASSAGSAEDDAAERLVREVAGPGVEKLRLPAAPSDRDALAARTEAALGAALREILLDPAFRALEATWRGLELLVRRAETSPELQVHVLDLSRDELVADVGVSGSLETSGLHRILVEEAVGTPDAVPWTLVVADFAFDAVPRDVAALLRVARIASAAEAVVVAAADGRIVGCRSLAETPDAEDWTFEGDPVGRDLFAALRRVPEAARLALVWPSFVLRAPYGPGREETEGFPFDEAAGAGTSIGGRALWGNPAWAAAVVLARAFSAAGWDLRSALDPEIDDLPALVVETDGERELFPAVGAPLTSRAAERIRARGVVPLLPFRERAAVRLGSLDSVADPPSPLAGRWN